MPEIADVGHPLAGIGVSAPDRAGRRSERRLLRDLMIEAGLKILEHRGLGLEADSISYAKVFKYLLSEYTVRVSRGSVHERIWTGHEEFRREV